MFHHRIWTLASSVLHQRWASLTSADNSGDNLGTALENTQSEKLFVFNYFLVNFLLSHDGRMQSNNILIENLYKYFVPCLLYLWNIYRKNSFIIGLVAKVARDKVMMKRILLQSTSRITMTRQSAGPWARWQLCAGLEAEGRIKSQSAVHYLLIRQSGSKSADYHAGHSRGYPLIHDDWKWMKSIVKV